eukprot:8602619-Alexandrium_andersonii.AAC.1
MSASLVGSEMCIRDSCVLRVRRVCARVLRPDRSHNRTQLRATCIALYPVHAHPVLRGSADGSTPKQTTPRARRMPHIARTQALE